jgi:predicted O-linked N-acetylglucosamine transferase (SPINDLY family)
MSVSNSKLFFFLQALCDMPEDEDYLVSDSTTLPLMRECLFIEKVSDIPQEYAPAEKQIISTSSYRRSTAKKKWNTVGFLHFYRLGT